MNKSIKNTAQGGFTLIELIVVIVILGILAATALPKFTNLSADARAASLNAAKGAISTAASLTHGTALVRPAAIDSGTNMMNVEGVSVLMDPTSMYPAADDSLAAAAGLSDEDYDIVSTATTVTVSPKNVANKATCSVVYTETTTANTAPTIAMDASNCN